MFEKLRTAPQSSDQSFEDRNNAALQVNGGRWRSDFFLTHSLQRSVETQKPVRVIRGFKGKARSKYAPSEGSV
jgi:E3 ubiquitin-protein ligase UHRF1